MKITKQQIIESGPRVKRSHVVLLGAGASRAAFPNGDANGKRLPLMRDLVATLKIQDDLFRFMPKLRENTDLYEKWCGNFETCYSELHAQDPKSPLIRTIEEKVNDYFGALQLPPHATLYDQLVLSLRGTDSILTFNWDPFLADAWERNAKHIDPGHLPHIYHLHGNVRVGHCQGCSFFGTKNTPCPHCNKQLTSSPLLFPVGEKNYEENPLIKSQWDAARLAIQDSILFTVFGYSAPMTDQAARDILHAAWQQENGTELIRRIEIVDIRNADEIAKNWKDFAFHQHYDIKKTLKDSVLGMCPRRSGEVIFSSGWEGKYVEPFPFEQTLDDLRDAAFSIVEFE